MDGGKFGVEYIGVGNFTFGIGHGSATTVECFTVDVLLHHRAHEREFAKLSTKVNPTIVGHSTAHFNIVGRRNADVVFELLFERDFYHRS